MEIQQACKEPWIARKVGSHGCQMFYVSFEKTLKCHIKSQVMEYMFLKKYVNEN
jgi:hypothetical protein